jgi:thiamine biosynthesis lipoprotein
MKRIFCVLAAAAMLLSGCGAAPEASVQFFAMDTVMNVKAYGSGGQEAAEQIQDTIQKLENLLSRTQEDSEVSVINDQAGQDVTVSDVTGQLIAAACDYSQRTNGAFDITIAPVSSAWGFTTDSYQVPDQQTLSDLLKTVDSSRVSAAPEADAGDYLVQIGADQAIDLGGIAKGYASDRAESIFRADGIDSGLVYLGGNVYAHGSKTDGSAWVVAVQDPNNPEGYAALLSLKDSYAVTSGGYQRYFEQNGKTYHHILDPKTGYPADNGLLSVTVVADANGEDLGTQPGNGTMCDALSTALFVMGEEQALDFWRSSGLDFELVLVTDDGRVVITEGLADQYEEVEGTDYTYEVVR